ncbi:MAG: endo-1,4-beta-xylanase [Prolixibacteraceae bacterium]
MKIVSVLFLLLVNGVLFAQIPDGGIQLNAPAGRTYEAVGIGTLTVVDVVGQEFTKALQFATGTEVNNYWDTKIIFPSVQGIAVNDVILVAFMARTIYTGQESGEGFVSVVIENKSTYDKEISQQLAVGSEWKRCYASLKSSVSLAPSEVSYGLFLGYPSQTLEIAEVQFLNYKNTIDLIDLPVTEITYEGQDDDAGWRAAAQQRIEQIRKGTIDIVVHDEQGELLKNAEVTIEMQKHKFGFGTAIKAEKYLQDKAFRDKVYELFNEVVFENDLKWPNFDPEDTWNIRRALQSLNAAEIPVRAHTIVWPSWNQTPEWLENLKSDPVALRAAIDKHIEEVTQLTAGQVVDWDVINEPFKERDVMEILGNEVMADWFKRVRNNDPKAKLFLNEYGIVSGGGNNTEKQDFYYDLINFIDDNGGQVDGIGIQGHFGSQLTSIVKVYSILDRYADLGKEIKITEHDIDISQREVQAMYTRDFLTICFSHESVKSFMFWGFWVYQHWKPDAAMIGPNWEPRPHGEKYIDLVFNQWWTKETTHSTDASGKTSFEGFLGEYSYTIKSNGEERSGTFAIDHSIKSGMPNSLVLSFDPSVPDKVEITSDRSGYMCQGENITLKTINVEDAAYTWYRNDSLLNEQNFTMVTGQAGLYSVHISINNTELVSKPFEVIVHPFPTVEIEAMGNLMLNSGEQVELKVNVASDASYNWFRNESVILGSVSSMMVGRGGTYNVLASSNGCSTMSNSLNVQNPTGINDILNQFTIYPNPVKDSFHIKYQLKNNQPATATLYNALGEFVSSEQLMQLSGNTRIELPNPGFYVLRISSSKGSVSYKVMGI